MILVDISNHKHCCTDVWSLWRYNLTSTLHNIKTLYVVTEFVLGENLPFYTFHLWYYKYVNVPPLHYITANTEVPLILYHSYTTEEKPPTHTCILTVLSPFTEMHSVFLSVLLWFQWIFQLHYKLVSCQQTLNVQTQLFSSENVKMSSYALQSNEKCNKAAEFSDVYEQYNH